MQVRSYGSVKVIYLDRPAVLEATRKAVQELAENKPEIQRVVLFGSMARGDAVPGSDVDLLIVLSKSRRPFLNRISWYRPAGIPIGVDVFAYTERELKRMQREGNPFLKSATDEGIVLFDRSSERPETNA